MYKEIKILRQHGIQYVKDLRRQPVSELFRGRPVISADITGKEIEIVSSLCPSGAIDDKSGAIEPLPQLASIRVKLKRAVSISFQKKCFFV